MIVSMFLIVVKDIVNETNNLIDVTGTLFSISVG